ncbi:hypothetical protein [Brachybacterium phenoliresistens]|nr:hypothetical protein [Brachybacterium phenoliresistens]
MSPTTTPTMPTTPAARRAVPRLGARTRKAVLSVHLAAMGTWLGMDVVLGILVAAALRADGPTSAVMARAIGVFVGLPLVAAAVATLVSGIVLGLGSKYGLLRYWWVGVKLVLTVVLTVLVIVVLVPSVAELAEAAAASQEAGGAGSARFVFDRQLIYPPVVSTAALLFAAAISVIKPWGRRGRERGGR